MDVYFVVVVLWLWLWLWLFPEFAEVKRES